MRVIPGDQFDESKRFDSAVLNRIYEDAGNQLGIDDIGLQVGQKFTTSTLSLTGQILPLCPTFGLALKMISRYHLITQSFAFSEGLVDQDEFHFFWRPHVDNFDRYHHATEAIFTGFAIGARWILWGQEQPIKRIEFCHENSAPNADYSAVFGCEVFFNRPVDRIVFKAETIDAKIATANPELLESMIKKLDAAIIGIDHSQAFLHRVRATIRKQFGETGIKSEAAAAELGYSIRNFRYLLSKQNTSYREMVEQVRKEVCNQEILNGTQFSDIAQKLGFHDQSAFNRAFSKWYGMTPGRYKNSTIA